MTRDQIAALAYAIWEDRGRPEGNELDHWLEAERQLKEGARLTPSGVRDHIPATPGDPDHDPAVEGKIEAELEDIIARREPRSPTAL